MARIQPGESPGARLVDPKASQRVSASSRGEVLDEALWFACEAMVPATLLWLRVYRQNQPEFFCMAP